MWHRTVRCSTGQSGASLILCSDFCRVYCSALFTVRVDRWAQMTVAPLAHRTVRCTPDSPVNFSGATSHFPEGGEFESEFPGAPDRYCSLSGGTPDSPVRQTRGAFGCPFAPFF